MIVANALYAANQRSSRFRNNGYLQGAVWDDLLDDNLNSGPLGTPGFTILESQLLERQLLN